MTLQRGVLASIAVSALGLTGCGGASQRKAPPPTPATRVVIFPHSGGVRTVFRVGIFDSRPIGVWQHAIHGYRVRVLASRLRNGCIVDSDGFVHARAPGHGASITLDPSRIMGQQWCPGQFTATVSYYTAYACPARGPCRPPTGFASHSTVLARLRFTVAG